MEYKGATAHIIATCKAASGRISESTSFMYLGYTILHYSIERIASRGSKKLMLHALVPVCILPLHTLEGAFFSTDA